MSFTESGFRGRSCAGMPLIYVTVSGMPGGAHLTSEGRRGYTLSCQLHGVRTRDPDYSLKTRESIRNLIFCPPAAVSEAGCGRGQSGGRFYMRTSLPTHTWCKTSGGGGGERGCWVMFPGPQSHKSK